MNYVCTMALMPMSWIEAKNTPELNMEEYDKVFPAEPTETRVEFLVYAKGARYPGIHVFGALPDGQKVRGFIPAFHRSGDKGTHPHFRAVKEHTTPTVLTLHMRENTKGPMPILDLSA